MTPIINRSFNKHPMAWEIIHCRLIHPSDIVIKSMCHHQTLDGIPKHFPNKLNKSPCTICYTEKMTTFPQGSTVDISNLKPSLLTVINMQINGDAQQRHQQNFIYANSTIHSTISYLDFHGMFKSLASMNL